VALALRRPPASLRCAGKGGECRRRCQRRRACTTRVWGARGCWAWHIAGGGRRSTTFRLSSVGRVLLVCFFVWAASCYCFSCRQREGINGVGDELAGGLCVVSFGETMRSHWLFCQGRGALESEPWIFNSRVLALSMILSTHFIPIQLSLSVFPIVLLLCLLVAVIWLELIVKLRFILIDSFLIVNINFLSKVIERSPIIMLFEPV
jgi:hypothetical protein